MDWSLGNVRQHFTRVSSRHRANTRILPRSSCNCDDRDEKQVSKAFLSYSLISVTTCSANDESETNHREKKLFISTPLQVNLCFHKRVHQTSMVSLPFS